MVDLNFVVRTILNCLFCPLQKLEISMFDIGVTLVLALDLDITKLTNFILIKNNS